MGNSQYLGPLVLLLMTSAPQGGARDPSAPTSVRSPHRQTPDRCRAHGSAVRSARRRSVVVPEPRKRSSTRSPCRVTSWIASATSPIGLTVGCRARSSRRLPCMELTSGAVAAVPAEFDHVEVGHRSDPVDKDQFMLGPVERSHAGIGLVPDAEVQALAAKWLSRLPRRSSTCRQSMQTKWTASSREQCTAAPSVSARKQRNSFSLISPDAIANSR